MKIPNLRLHEEFLPTRRTLLSRLKNLDDSASWQDFFNTYAGLIFSYALRFGLTRSEAEDVVQDTIIAVSRKMPEFTYDPKRSFKGWLLQTTRWRIQDQFRKRRGLGGVPANAADGGTGAEALDMIADPAGEHPDQIWEEEWQNNLVAAAVDKIKTQVSPRQYQVFDLHVMKGWPVEKVVDTLHVSKASVYLNKLRISRLLRQEVERLKDKAG